MKKTLVSISSIRDEDWNGELYDYALNIIESNALYYSKQLYTQHLNDDLYVYEDKEFHEHHYSYKKNKLDIETHYDLFIFKS